MTNQNDPLDQLSAFRVEVDGPTRDTHLHTIDKALRETPVRRRSKWPLAAVVAAVIAGPVAAIASVSAVPGDALYSVKLIVEPALQLFDTDVVARNRVDEVRVLIERASDEAVISVSIDVARAELAETDAPDASRELDRLVSDWVSDKASSEDPPSDVRPPATVPRQRDDQSDRIDPTVLPSDRDSPANTKPPTGDASKPSTSSTSSATSTTVSTDRPRDGDGGGDRPPPP